MAGHSRPKDGVASARLRPAIHFFLAFGQVVDARDKPGHDGFSLPEIGANHAGRGPGRHPSFCARQDPARMAMSEGYRGGGFRGSG